MDDMTATVTLERPPGHDTRERDRTTHLILAGVMVLGAIGFVGSFTKVAAFAAEAPHNMERPWLLPVGVDAAIAFFTALDLALTRDGKRVGWFRWFVWLMIGTTIGLNVAGEADLFGVLAHAALPTLWVAAVEAAKATIYARAVEVTDRIPLARWLYAPVPTLLIHRRMRLWGVTSYAEALEIDTRRVLARCDLLEAHGWRWRWTPAARRQRALYRRGQLEPEAPTAAPEPAAEEARPVEPAPRPAPRRRPPARKRRARQGPLSDDELAAVACELAAADPAVLSSWKTLAAALRAKGHGLGSKRGPTVLELARARRREADGGA